MLKFWRETQIPWTVHFRLTYLQPACCRTSRNYKKIAHFQQFQPSPAHSNECSLPQARPEDAACRPVPGSAARASQPTGHPWERLLCGGLCHSGASTAATWTAMSSVAGVDDPQPPRHAGARVGICALPFAGHIINLQSSSCLTAPSRNASRNASHLCLNPLCGLSNHIKDNVSTRNLLEECLALITVAAGLRQASPCQGLRNFTCKRQICCQLPPLAKSTNTASVNILNWCQLWEKKTKSNKSFMRPDQTISKKHIIKDLLCLNKGSF